MLPVKIGMVLAGLTALSAGAVAGWFVLSEPIAQVQAGVDRVQVAAPAVTPRADAQEPMPAAKSEPAEPLPPPRSADAPPYAAPAPAPATAVEPTRPARIAEAPPAPAPGVAPDRVTPGKAAPGNPGVRLIRDDDDDDDDDC